MIRIIVFLITLVGQNYLAHGLDHSVTIQAVSKSRRTMALNKGSQENIKYGDYGLLIQKVELKTGKFLFKPVAKLKLLKLKEASSIWGAYKVFIPNLIDKGKTLLLLSESQMLNGRKHLEFERKTLVTNKDSIKEVKDFLTDNQNLSKNEDSYIVIENLEKAKRRFEADVELIDVQKWENKFGDDKLYASGIYRSPHAKEFSQRKRVQSFEKMANAFLNKFNEPGFEYGEFFSEQKRASVGEISENPMPETITRNIELDFEKQERQDKELIESLKDGGQGWSKVYSDDQLKRVLQKVSLAKERQRRKGLSSKKFKFQFYIGGGVNLVNNENLNDSATTEQSKFDIESSIEGYIIQTFRNFEKITFELSMRRSQDAFVGDTLNVKSNEISSAIHINWYPFYNPNVLNQHIVYFGILSRYGFTSLTNETSDEVGNYSLNSFPGVRVSLKYNFENGFGYRVHAGLENISVRRNGSTSSTGNLPDSASYTDGKLAISLSKFF